MGEKVRDIDPPPSATDGDDITLDGRGVRELELPAARDLGPNGDGVLDILRRTARLTPAEGRAIEAESDWRWWSVTPLVGTTVAAAQARAIVVGRSAGRGAAIATLDKAIHRALAFRDPGGRESTRLAACVRAAGLAALVCDLIEPETFLTLSGPWRAVMHR